MSRDESPAPARFDGLDAAALAGLLGIPGVILRDAVDSTMDLAHEAAAAGAPAGSLVLADAQRAGRGRNGRSWASHPGGGLWLTLIERPADPAALQVLSLRLGLRLAEVLDRYATARVGLKWPNDLYVDGGKLGGILVEARWREGRADWAAIGIGINVVAPSDVPAARGLAPAVRRLAVLADVVAAARAAASAAGALSADEVRRFSDRDIAAGRACREPTPGVVRGINAEGELLIASGSTVASFRGGSLILVEDT
jgi:BirA family biotin operon repressor/biotin-[acetyl-CoA-carboxylase] ligase